jgi:hypothetical protein
MPKINFGERRQHWLRNVTEPIGTYSVQERACALHRIRTAATRFAGQRPRPPARLETV